MGLHIPPKIPNRAMEIPAFLDDVPILKARVDHFAAEEIRYAPLTGW
jgi:hypothetical protein